MRKTEIAVIVGFLLLGGAPLGYLFYKESVLKEEEAKAVQLARAEAEAKKAREARQLEVEVERQRQRQRDSERALDERLRLEELERQQAVSRKKKEEYEKVMRATNAAIAELEALKRVSRDLERLAPYWQSVLSTVVSASTMSKHGARGWMGRGQILAQEVLLVDVTGCALTVRQSTIDAAMSIETMAAAAASHSGHYELPDLLTRVATYGRNAVFAAVSQCKQTVDADIARLGRIAEEMKPIGRARP